MKQLTQAIFKDAPDWVKSATVDSNGELWFYNVKSSELQIMSHTAIDYEYWYMKSDRMEDWASFYPAKVSDGYDTTNWKNSAIDREFAA